MGLRWFSAGFGLFYIVALVYKTYASALLGIYKMEANFFNDYSFVLGGMSFFLDALNLSLWVYLAGGTAIIALIGFLGVTNQEENGLRRDGRRLDRSLATLEQKSHYEYDERLEIQRETSLVEAIDTIPARVGQ